MATSGGPVVLSTMCSISLHLMDRLRLVSFPMELLASFRHVLQTSWKKGIQAEDTYGCSYEFKLKGSPWAGASEQAVDSRRLVIGIMRFMLTHGWRLELTADLSKKENDKDSWFFRKQDRVETDVVMCAISFNQNDRIRVIDASPEVAEAVHWTINNRWPRGLQNVKTYYGAQEFKLHGYPWFATGTETVQTTAFVLSLLDALRNVGWIVYASVDVSLGYEGMDLDSWVLKKVKL